MDIRRNNGRQFSYDNLYLDCRPLVKPCERTHCISYAAYARLIHSKNDYKKSHSTTVWLYTCMWVWQQCFVNGGTDERTQVYNRLVALLCVPFIGHYNFSHSIIYVRLFPLDDWREHKNYMLHIVSSVMVYSQRNYYPSIRVTHTHTNHGTAHCIIHKNSYEQLKQIGLMGTTQFGAVHWRLWRITCMYRISCAGFIML